ncbi:hypothetical protein KSD_67500 [Ktedonobacter sp. SOSP1-85]|nr:hypothetical protein KSD_67500 [Ktedonobacter sp. SOSP1-85]
MLANITPAVDMWLLDKMSEDALHLRGSLSRFGMMDGVTIETDMTPSSGQENNPGQME